MTGSAPTRWTLHRGSRRLLLRWREGPGGSWDRPKFYEVPTPLPPLLQIGLKMENAP